MSLIIWIFWLVIILLISILLISSIISSIINWIPQVSTFNSDFKVMKKELKKYNIKWKKIIDLWSWTWKSIRFFEKFFNAKTTWCEIDLSNYLISKILNKILWYNAIIIRWNYLKIELNKYDFIYIYLLPKIIDKAEKRIWEKAKKWTIIFSNAFKFINHTPIEILKDEKGKEEIYVYKV